MAKLKPKISLTDFIDYAFKTGLLKRSSVNKVMKRGEYHPAFDYWKKLRDGIAKFHESGGTWKEKGQLDQIFEQATTKKTPNYHECITAYQKWMGRKEIDWFQPPRAIAPLKADFCVLTIRKGSHFPSLCILPNRTALSFYL